MNIAEILRKLADIADQSNDPAVPDENIQNPAQLSPAAAGMPVNSPDNADAGEDDAVMIPPLQLKVELLKRAVGVDNVYDEGGPRSDQTHDHASFDDELAVMKNRAGIPVAAVMELGNDEILDD
jgi:hypothetical protein